MRAESSTLLPRAVPDFCAARRESDVERISAGSSLIVTGPRVMRAPHAYGRTSVWRPVATATADLEGASFRSVLWHTDEMNGVFRCIDDIGPGPAVMALLTPC